MIAMDSKSGKEIAHLPTPESMDEVYFDAAQKGAYVSGGRDLQVGFAYVYQQKDADDYETLAKSLIRDDRFLVTPARSLLRSGGSE
jgi:hypothetical protein